MAGEQPQVKRAGRRTARPSAAARLAGSDELARLLLASTGEGIYGIDVVGNCTFANPACLRLLGFESDADLIGRNMHKLVHHTRPNGDPYPEKECRIYQAFRRGEGTHVDDEIMFHANGTSFPAEYRSYPVDRDGEIVGCVVTFRDITERRQSEALLADQQAMLAEVARFPEMNPGPVLRLSLDGNVLMDNPAARDVFGAELIGKCWLDVCPDIDQDNWRGILAAEQAVALERQIGEREFVFTHRRDHQGTLVFVFGMDLTEQKRAERALRERDELVRLLLNSTGEGIYGVDLQGNCTFANPACARLLGFEDDSHLLGKQMHDLVHHTRPNGEPYPVEECRIYRAFRNGKGTHVDDEVMFRADGHPFPAEYWSYPVVRDGALVGCVVTFVDITERRRIEEELRQTEKMAALGKLSAGLAHELNNPAAAAGRASGQLQEALDDVLSATLALTRSGIERSLWDSLTTWVNDFRERSDAASRLSPLELSDREEELSGWLESRGVSEPWSMAPTLVSAGIEGEDLETISSAVPPGLVAPVMSWLERVMTAYDLAATVARSAGGISDLVGTVKSYSYMDQAPVQWVDVHRGIEDTLTILKHKWKRGIEIVREFDHELPPIQVQGSELNQVWTNIIDNAISALGERGTITVRTFRDGHDIAVSIADDGPGIPKEVQSRIFEPFFTTKEVGQGTGLGLDVARRIVTGRCGGRIDFTSKPGETVFVVRLPIGEPKGEADAESEVSTVVGG